MEFVLWIIAVVLVIAGIVALVRGEYLWGAVLIVVGLLVGPGGVSVFTDDGDDATSIEMVASPALGAHVGTT